MDDDKLQELTERLDHIEKYLVNLGQVAGYRYGPFSAGVTPEVVDLVRMGKINDAIKLHRQQTNVNFQQAQDVVAQIQAAEQSRG